MAVIRPRIRRSVANSAPVIKVLAMLLLVLAVLMVMPLGVLILEVDPDRMAFLLSIAIVAGTALVMLLITRGVEILLRPRQMFILTTLSWVLVSAFASLPLILGAPQLSFTDAVFESVSAITTTGSTVLVGIDDLSDGLKLWRDPQWRESHEITADRRGLGELLGIVGRGGQPLAGRDGAMLERHQGAAGQVNAIGVDMLEQRGIAVEDQTRLVATTEGQRLLGTLQVGIFIQRLGPQLHEADPIVAEGPLELAEEDRIVIFLIADQVIVGQAHRAQDRMVRLREGVIVQLFLGHPAHRLALAAEGLALEGMHLPDIEQDTLVFVFMVDANERLGSLYLDTEFFAQFPPECFEAGFVGRQLATGKFPQAPLIDDRGAACEQHMPILTNDGSRRDVYPSLHHVGHFTLTDCS